MDVHTIMALRPLAPVLRSIACRAIALMASWVNSKLHYKHRTVIENTLLAFLPPANEVCEGYVFTGVCLSTRGGVHGFIWGGWGACVVLFGGACMVLFGGHAWFYLGGMHGFIQGACVVLFGGYAWFYSGGACVVLFGACMFYSGGCMVFSVFSDTMRYGQ